MTQCVLSSLIEAAITQGPNDASLLSVNKTLVLLGAAVIVVVTCRGHQLYCTSALPLLARELKKAVAGAYHCFSSSRAKT